jgi:cytochrome c551/c552
VRAFTGRRALVVAVLAASLALPGCGGGGDEAAPTSTAAAPRAGDAAAGKSIFAEQGCGSCHTFAAAQSTGAIGPNLDEALEKDASRAGKPLAEFVRESIVEPDAFVAPDFKPGVMPKTFAESLNEQQLADLVAFLTRA